MGQRLLTKLEKPFKVATPPPMLQLEHCNVSSINAKIWVSVNLSQVTMVPTLVAKMMRMVTLSEAVELKGTKIHINEVKLEQKHRSSVKNIALSFAKAYAPQVMKITGSVLGSSNIGQMVTFIPKGIATGAGWLVEHALLTFSGHD